MAKNERPVLAGLIALVSVAAVVGVILGAATLVGTRVLGLDGGTPAVADTGLRGGESLYLPTPSATESDNDPLITLAPGEETSPTNTGPTPEVKKDESEKKGKLTLAAGQESVGAFEPIDLTGTYSNGAGTVLVVQRQEPGSDRWVDFNVAANVDDDGTFSTYVETGKAGVNKWRVVDPDSKTRSNVVEVRVG